MSPRRLKNIAPGGGLVEADVHMALPDGHTASVDFSRSVGPLAASLASRALVVFAIILEKFLENSQY